MGEFDDYKNENCEVTFLSNLEPSDGENLIGKVIKRIEADEYELNIYFTDGYVLKINGYKFTDCALGVDLELP